MKRASLSAAAAVAALLLVVAYAAGMLSSKIQPSIEPKSRVDLSDAVAVTVRRDTTTEAVAASVEAREATIVSSRVLARITAIHVRAGDVVERGELLLTLEAEDLVARAQQAAEQVRAVAARQSEAQRNLQRATELHQRGLIAIADRDAARATADALVAEMASAEQALAAARTAAEFARVRAPITGRVVDRFAEPGDTAVPGQKLLSLYNPSSLWVEVRVREQLALALESGQHLAVELPALELHMQARIEEIVPAADPGSRSFLIKALLPEAVNLRPGMYARVEVPVGEQERVLIPVDRTAQLGQLDVVWVAGEGARERRFVRLGRTTSDGLVEVLAGLDAGEQVLPVPAI
jgi:RND family efflux transporter MFP subunit